MAWIISLLKLHGTTCDICFIGKGARTDPERSFSVLSTTIHFMSLFIPLRYLNRWSRTVMLLNGNAWTALLHPTWIEHIFFAIRGRYPAWPDRWLIVPKVSKTHAKAPSSHIGLGEWGFLAFHCRSVECCTLLRSWGVPPSVSPLTTDRTLDQDGLIAKHIFDGTIDVSSWARSSGHLRLSVGIHEEGISVGSTQTCWKRKWFREACVDGVVVKECKRRCWIWIWKRVFSVPQGNWDGKK